MTANAGGAAEVDMLVQQGADWRGIRVPMLTDTGQPFDPSYCKASGAIKLRRTSTSPIFTWSNEPEDGEGTIELAPAGVVWSLLAAHSLGWTFTEARYEIKLYNPAGPVGDRDIRVAQGAVILDLQLDRTPLP